jgi:hypothetical protein
MTTMRTVHASGPADLLALVPALFGFHPEESVVLMSLGGAPEPFHARVDLPGDPVELDDLVRYLVGVARRSAVRSFAVLVYGDDAALAEDLVERLAWDLRAASLRVRCAVRADGRHWWALGRHGDGAAGGPGTPYDIGSHPLTAEAVVEGTVVLGSRRELADTLVGEPGDVAEVERCVAAATSRLRRPTRARLVTEGRWVQRRLRRHLVDHERLDAADVARLLVLMQLSIEVRDVAWAEMTRENSAAHVDLWRDVLRRSPAELGAAPAALLGFAAWLRGHGALAWCAVERCQESRPDYGLAGLLTHALSGALPPSAWRPIPPASLSLFDPPGPGSKPR